jgi:putative tryptophan/tyrosine transport system substrate-binding protein
MNRRNIITLLGGAAAWPLTARAQQPAMPVIGYMASGAAESSAAYRVGFYQGLGQVNYSEGRNVAITYRYAEGHYERLSAFAADLVQRRVAVIVAAGGSAPGLAAKAATSTIPIVFQTGSDPVADGLVARMNRPGGNVTGVTRVTAILASKRVGLLLDLIPRTTAITILVNPNQPIADWQVQEMHEVARSFRLALQVLKAATEQELDAAFATLVRQGGGPLLAANDPFFVNRRQQIAGLALRHSIPVMLGERDSVVAGGLVSYGASLKDSMREVGVYVGRILKGEKPADLPVLQPTKFELVINLKTAKALGLSVPDKLLAIADEVIE